MARRLPAKHVQITQRATRRPWASAAMSPMVRMIGRTITAAGGARGPKETALAPRLAVAEARACVRLPGLGAASSLREMIALAREQDMSRI
jgi:hypothetical protein